MLRSQVIFEQFPALAAAAGAGRAHIKSMSNMGCGASVQPPNHTEYSVQKYANPCGFQIRRELSCSGSDCIHLRHSFKLLTCKVKFVCFEICAVQAFSTNGKPFALMPSLVEMLEFALPEARCVVANTH